MLETIYAFIYGDDLFITSPVFFFVLVGPFLCLFVMYIIRALKAKGMSRKVLANGLSYKD